MTRSLDRASRNIYYYTDTLPDTLPAEVVSCNDVTCFKVKVDQIFKNDWGLT